MNPRSCLGRFLPAIAGVLTCVSMLGLRPDPALAQNLGYAKMLIHLDAMYRPPTSLNCSGGSTANVTGDLNTDYYAFVVAANVDTSQGLLSASFGIYYHPDDLTGLNIGSWQSLGDAAVPGANWPLPGTGMAVSFYSCRGKTADPADAQGRGLVVLGYFTVSATSPDYLFIVPRFADGNTPVTLVDCSLHSWVVSAPSNLGDAGFQYAGSDPCLGPIDRFPEGCCLQTGCQDNLDPLYCQFLGGVLPPVPLTGCGDFNCTVPVVPMTWGRIKALYH